MATSKAQREGVLTTCKCGCGVEFRAFPVYRKKADGGGLRIPEYQRGHHPNCKKPREPWNKGLKKGDHPSLERMGFQPGHEPFNDWSHVNELLATDPELRARWLAAKKGQVAWNKGLSRDEYPNGIASGSEHGNWKGGARGHRDTAEYQRFRRRIFERDDYTCQECGARNKEGRGQTVYLNMHHVVSVCDAPERIFDLENVITLCEPCHHATENFGSKAVSKHK